MTAGSSKETFTPQPGVSLRWLMDDTIERDAGLSLARMTVDAGVTSEAHRHPNCSEVVHVLSGMVEQRNGDDWVSLNAGDTLLVPCGVVHQFRNVATETAVLMLAYSSGSRVYETEID